MRARPLFAAIAALVLAVAMVAPVAGTQGQRVPFRMHAVGADRPLNMSPGFPFVRDTFGGRCSIPSDWVTTIDLRGTATHLGRVTVVASHCTQINIFTTPNPGVFEDGRMVVTAANGDELWLAYEGSFLFTPTTSPEAGISDISFSTVTVVGGTGRFTGATGSIPGSAVDNFPAGPDTADLAGWIVYDPAVAAH